MSHGAAGWYHAALYGALAVCFFGMLWRWRGWYVTAPDGAPARRSLRLVGGAALLFVALWLTCGRVSMGIEALRWAVSPVALAGMGLLALGGGPGPERQQARGPGVPPEAPRSGAGEHSGPPPATEEGRGA